MEALDWLFQQFPSYQVIGSKAFKPTLDNSRKILSFLGNPETNLRFVHVAGSNGKGSVCSYLASILKESGLKVGLFTSPHIVHFSERIRVNGVPIPDSKIADFVANMRTSPLPFQPSFFEITFGMALQHFQDEKCDICIIETGLGGRLDATNVINPLLSVITSISLEHTEMLGHTIEAIAEEKAGIIKDATPVILGGGCHHVSEVFEEQAKKRHAPLYFADPLPDEFDSYFLAKYQKENFACVLQTLKILPFDINQEIIVKGIQNVMDNSGYFGRFQSMQSEPRIIFDVAHNPDGIQSTLELILRTLEGKLYIIYGSSKDKDHQNCIATFPQKAHVFATEFSNPRSLKQTELKTIFYGTNFKSIAYYQRGTDALKRAKEVAGQEDTIVVLGSFFLLSDFF